MSKNNYEDKLRSFVSNNADLIGEYESMDCALPIEYCVVDIIDNCQKLLKLDKTADFNKTMKDAFTESIRHHINVIDSFDLLINRFLADTQISNSTQQYFKEINDIYNRHNNEYDIEYCPENRDKLIEMNLKTVISIAKKYQGMGLSLQELISAGNLGLVVAWDKFDPSRSKLKDDILNAISSLPDEFDYDVMISAVHPYFEYGDIQKKFCDKFVPNNSYTKKELIKWINSNVYNAKFNSIATMWIRAYILIELDNNSRVVKKPKVEIYKDREKYGAYRKETTLDIDAPISTDTDTSFGDLLKLEDETLSDMDVAEAYDTYKSNLMKLLDGVKPRDRSIFLKKFGIGLPRPMLPKEIADQEGLSIARISQIFQTVIEQIQENQVKYDIDPNLMFSVVKKFR
jgi:RNA polymerase primary sigma factor